MYSNLLPKAGFVLSGAGVAMSFYNVTWLVIGFFVIGGALVTLSKFFPRFALEPLSETDHASHAHWRWRVTVNGHALGGRHRR
jgi:hypothetical protein